MILLYLILLFSFIFSRGEFTYAGSFILLIFLLLIVVFLICNKTPKFNFDAKIILVILCSLSIIVYGGFYQTDYVMISYSLLSISLFLSVLLLLINKVNVLKFFCVTMFAIALLTRVLMILGSPNPHIDIYDVLKIGAKGLSEGINPYTNTYTKLYEGPASDTYVYLPGMIFLTLPSVLIFNDPRYSLIVADILIALLIFKIVRDKQNRLIFPLLFLYHPLALTVLEESMTDPFLLLLLLGAVYTFLHKKNKLTSIIFGLTLGTKQYAIFLLPLLLRLFLKRKDLFTVILGSFTTLLVLILPFLVWDKDSFLQGVIFELNDLPARPWSLTLNSLLYHLNIQVNQNILTVILFLVIILFYLQKIKTPSRFLYISAAVLFFFFFFNKWSALNYWYLVGQLILLGYVIEGVAKEEA